MNIYILKAYFGAYEDSYDTVLLVSSDKTKVEQYQKELEAEVKIKNESRRILYNKLTNAFGEEKQFIREQLEQFESICDFNGFSVEEYELEKLYPL